MFQLHIVIFFLIFTFNSLYGNFIVSADPFEETTAFNPPADGATIIEDSFTHNSIFSTTAQQGRYIYKRGIQSTINTPESDKWVYSNRRQTFEINVTSISSSARWKPIHQYNNSSNWNMNFSWETLQLGSNEIEIQAGSFLKMVGFIMEGDFEFDSFIHSYEVGSDTLSLSTSTDDSNGSNDSSDTDGSDNSDNTGNTDGSDDSGNTNSNQSPNIILIISDDHRWDATKHMQTRLQVDGRIARFPWLETPNFDLLQSEGINFINAFTTFSTCSPSRATMLTGLYPHEHGVTNNSTSFPVDSITFASVLKDNGYSTGYFGKWHHGRQTERPGFDEVITYHGQGTYTSTSLFDGSGNFVRETGSNDWIDDVVTEEAINFIESNVNNKFMLVLGFKTPHEPFTPPTRTSNSYFNETAESVPNLNVDPVAIPFGPPNTQTLHEQNRKYMRTIKGIDQCVGDLLQKLDDLNINDQTAVIYISDNGFFRGEHKFWDKRAAYEESMRIPLVIKYPNHYSDSKEVTEIALNLDIAPTILDIAGLDIPDIMKGESLLELITDNPVTNWRKSFFYQYNHDPEFPTAKVRPCVALRHENGMKLIFNEEDNLYEGDWRELYDTTNDPYEINNLALSNQSTFSEMQNILLNKMDETEFMKILSINEDLGTAKLKLGKKYNFSVDASENLIDWSPSTNINREDNLSGSTEINMPTTNSENFIRVKYGKN